MSEFIIQFSGLSDGTHRFEFEIDKKFFDLINSDLIQNGNMVIHATMHKTSNLLTFDFKGDGVIDVECDRCTARADFPLEGEENSFLLIKLQNSLVEEESEMITLPLDQSEIDIAPYIFEFINSLMPLSVVPCDFLNDTDICNQEVLDRLDELTERKPISDDAIDPRGAELKNLKNENDN
jgi:uncharacterized metal-binding protein YceD (DUF177 family)